MPSFECLPPSHQILADDRARTRAYCNCCTRVGETSTVAHPILGQLCVWCARAFDYQLDALGLPIRERDTCPACSDGECAVHEPD